MERRIEAALPVKKSGLAYILKRDMKKNWLLYLFVLPALAFFIVFSYFPMAGLVMAFQDYDLALGYLGSPWVWFKHFRTFFQSMDFVRIVTNTLIFSALDIAFVFTTPIILALMLNGVKSRSFRRIVQTCVYLPYFISTVVVCVLIQQMFDAQGVFGVIFSKLGWSDGGSLVGDPQFFRGIIVASNLWQSIGFNSVIYIAALGGIDVCLYEAAELDGAGRMRKMWNVSLPSILPTIMMLLILKIGTVLNVSFEKVFLLDSDAVRPVSETISAYIYRYGAIGSSYSYTTAIGLFQSVFGFVLLVIANALSRKLTDASVF